LALRDDRAVVARPEACTYTGLCELSCPMLAIQRPFEIVALDSLTDEAIEENRRKVK
jgi:hypothetical protein